MPICKIEGLPLDYEVRADWKGRNFVLVYRDFDDIRLVAEWKAEPNLAQCLEEIAKYDHK